MPKVSWLKVSLNSTSALGMGSPCSGEIVPFTEPTSCRPGWSNGLGYLMLMVAPMAPAEVERAAGAARHLAAIIECLVESGTEAAHRDLGGGAGGGRHAAHAGRAAA